MRRHQVQRPLVKITRKLMLTSLAPGQLLLRCRVPLEAVTSQVLIRYVYGE